MRRPRVPSSSRAVQRDDVPQKQYSEKNHDNKSTSPKKLQPEQE